ncbi:MAG: isopentenyl-diphosphate Delta-isomerase [Patescibacteria group bacterium]
MSEQIILVDEKDNQIGSGEKLAVHQKGQLHRAFSILVFNSRGQLLIQQRSDSKYHCPGLWANTCCSHPVVGETIDQAAHRRLEDEMGFDCPLEEKGSFIYKVAFDNNLIEHEFDHVLVGYYDGDIKINPQEVKDSLWLELASLKKDMSDFPNKYAPWFKIIIDKFF